MMVKKDFMVLADYYLRWRCVLLMAAADHIFHSFVEKIRRLGFEQAQQKRQKALRLRCRLTRLQIWRFFPDRRKPSESSYPISVSQFVFFQGRFREKRVDHEPHLPQLKDNKQNDNHGRYSSILCKQEKEEEVLQVQCQLGRCFYGILHRPCVSS